MPELTPKALAAEWKAGRIRPAYLFLGEDAGAKALALEALKKLLAVQDLDFAEFPGRSDDEAPAAADACATLPMLSKRRLVVVRDARYGAAGRKILAEYLRRPLESAVLVLFSEEKKADPKDPAAAAVAAAGGVVRFAALSEADAGARLRDAARKAGCELSEDAARLMVEEAGSEWGILKAELDKVLLFSKGRGRAGVEEVAACLGFRREANVFDLAKFLERRDAARALALLRRLLEEGEDQFSLLPKIVGAVRTRLRAKRLVKSGAPEEAVFRQLRVSRYHNPDYLRTAAKTPEGALIRALDACLDTEAALKSQAWLDPRIELETLVLKVCGKERNK